MFKTRDHFGIIELNLLLGDIGKNDAMLMIFFFFFVLFLAV